MRPYDEEARREREAEAAPDAPLTPAEEHALQTEIASRALRSVARLLCGEEE